MAHLVQPFNSLSNLFPLPAAHSLGPWRVYTRHRHARQVLARTAPTPGPWGPCPGLGRPWSLVSFVCGSSLCLPAGPHVHLQVARVFRARLERRLRSTARTYAGGGRSPASLTQNPLFLPFPSSSKPLNCRRVPRSSSLGSNLSERRLQVCQWGICKSQPLDDTRVGSGLFTGLLRA